MTLDLNIKSVLTVTSTLLPDMIKRNKGHIVNLSSEGSRKNVPGSFYE